MEHLLKISDAYFADVLSGKKSFEIRQADRDYKVGDHLVLFEITEEKKETGRAIKARVTYILHGPAYGLMEGFCIMGIKLSKRQSRTNAGNHPGSEKEALDFGESIGMSKQIAMNCFLFYSKTGWKMTSGLPLANWKAAFRGWKSREKDTESREDEFRKLSLLLPMLLQRTAILAQARAEIIFKDPYIGTLADRYGWDRLQKPFNSFDAREMVQQYFICRDSKLGTPRLKGNPHGSRSATVPTIDEYQQILANREKT